MNPQKAVKLIDDDLSRAVVDFFWEELKEVMQNTEETSIHIPGLGYLNRNTIILKGIIRVNKRRLYRKTNGTQFERMKWSKELRHSEKCLEKCNELGNKIREKRKQRHEFIRNLEK